MSDVKPILTTSSVPCYMVSTEPLPDDVEHYPIKEEKGIATFGIPIMAFCCIPMGIVLADFLSPKEEMAALGHVLIFLVFFIPFWFYRRSSGIYWRRKNWCYIF